jgi:hypothetical protein
VQELQTLAGKLQTATQGGNADAREWQLDLRELALAVQAQQQQMNALLQAIHAMWQAEHERMQAAGTQAPVQAVQQAPAYAPGYPQQQGYPQQGYPQQGYPHQQGGMGSMLRGFLGSGFGQAVAMGAGIGLGEDLINQIF